MSFLDQVQHLGHTLLSAGQQSASHLTNWWHRRRGFDRNSEKLPPLVETTIQWIERNGEVSHTYSVTRLRCSFTSGGVV